MKPQMMEKSYDETTIVIYSLFMANDYYMFIYIQL
jgi:hypothetical protein